MVDVNPHQVFLILALPPIRPDINSGGYVLDRGSVLTLATELQRHAKTMTVKAIKVSVEPGGIQISIASR